MGSSSHVTTPTATLTTGTAGAEGTWVELVASTTIFTNWINIMLHDPSAEADFFIDIGVGANGEEVVEINDILHHSDPLGNNVTSENLLIKVDIDKYKRISARARNGSGGETIGLSLILTGVEFD